MKSKNVKKISFIIFGLLAIITSIFIFGNSLVTGLTIASLPLMTGNAFNDVIARSRMSGQKNYIPSVLRSAAFLPTATNNLQLSIFSKSKSQVATELGYTTDTNINWLANIDSNKLSNSQRFVAHGIKFAFFTTLVANPTGFLDANLTAEMVRLLALRGTYSFSVDGKVQNQDWLYNMLQPTYIYGSHPDASSKQYDSSLNTVAFKPFNQYLVGIDAGVEFSVDVQITTPTLPAGTGISCSLYGIRETTVN